MIEDSFDTIYFWLKSLFVVKGLILLYHHYFSCNMFIQLYMTPKLATYQLNQNKRLKVFLCYVILPFHDNTLILEKYKCNAGGGTLQGI